MNEGTKRSVKMLLFGVAGIVIALVLVTTCKFLSGYQSSDGAGLMFTYCFASLIGGLIGVGTYSTNNEYD